MRERILEISLMYIISLLMISLVIMQWLSLGQESLYMSLSESFKRLSQGISFPIPYLQG